MSKITPASSASPPSKPSTAAAETDSDEQGASRMFLYLTLDAHPHVVEISFSEPLSGRLHSTGDAFGDLTHAIAGDGNVRRAGRSTELAALAALTELVGARFERIGELVLRRARTFANGRTDVRELVFRVAREISRTISDAAGIAAAGRAVEARGAGAPTGAIAGRAAHVAAVAEATTRRSRGARPARAAASVPVRVPFHLRILQMLAHVLVQRPCRERRALPESAPAGGRNCWRAPLLDGATAGRRQYIA